MPIRDMDRKILWSRSGDECSMPDCYERLREVRSKDEAGRLECSGVVIGQEAHIRSGRPSGPRFDSQYPASKVDSYGNLLLLCPSHHVQVDADSGAGYSVELLEKIKDEHEKRITEARGALDDGMVTHLAAQLDAWGELIDISSWRNDLGSLFTYGPPHLLNIEMRERVQITSRWLMSRDWPTKYPTIVRAFEQHGATLNLFAYVVGEHFELSERYRDKLELPRLHKELRTWDPEAYNSLLREYLRQVTTTQWAAREVMRSINLVIWAVRQDFDRFYRYDEGYVLLFSSTGLYHSETRPQYSENSRRGADVFPDAHKVFTTIEDFYDKYLIGGDELDITDLP